MTNGESVTRGNLSLRSKTGTTVSCPYTGKSFAAVGVGMMPKPTKAFAFVVVVSRLDRTRLQAVGSALQRIEESEDLLFLFRR